MDDEIERAIEDYTRPQEPDLVAIQRHLSYDAYNQRHAAVPWQTYADRLLFASIIDYLNAKGYTPGYVGEFMRVWEGRDYRAEVRPDVMQVRKAERMAWRRRWATPQAPQE